MGQSVEHVAGHAAGLLSEWHEFYLMTGTAAVTLAGLLFVALSFNLDVLLHDSKVHVLAYARQTLLLGNAVGAAWDLLVQVGRMKIEEQEAARAKTGAAGRDSERG